MPANVTKLPDKAPRFVDPKAPPAEQLAQLRSLINDPPGNSRVVSFTPQLCQLILEQLNQGNRKLRPTKIQRFAQAMKEDSWELTGDTIKFSKVGRLIDGQNRMSASVLAKKPFMTHVVFGVGQGAFAVVDAGASRTGPDTLHIQGVKDPTITAQAVRWVILCGDMPKGERPARGSKIENRDLLEYYLDKIDAGEMRLAIEDAKNIGRCLDRLIPTGTMAGLLYLFGKRNQATRTRFSEYLQKAPGAVLMKKIRKVKRGAGGRINELQLLAWTIEAWNAFKSNGRFTEGSLKWNFDKDTYPSIS